ncbi:MAG: bifunctional hydroxymethylpyrimidine kinase/phosphomethylpyrimidine kinase [Peptococcaceae bacterium]|nr:bifunctional hydroxymethylpyrimidine kinase/phosphomethylpyrimidine kinase [Peptococcaceae bacterium]
MKKVLTIAGSDCSGGAGIQADLKTFSAHGVFGMSIILSVVAQNTSRVIGVQDISPALIEQQMDAVFEDGQVDAVKIGMLSTSLCMETLACKLRRYTPPHVVVDPVMNAKGGYPLMSPSAVNTFIRVMLPLAHILTPNIPEAIRIIQSSRRTTAPQSLNSIGTLQDMEDAARRIHSLGCRYVLVKGGHATGDAVDVLFDGQTFFHYTAPRIHTKNTHGTGCTYSSAIAASLAAGLPAPQAVERAKAYVTTAIEHALDIGQGHGPLHHFYDMYRHGLQT